jgi:histone H3/H4
VAKSKKKQKELSMLVVGARVKEVNAECELRTGGDFTEALNEKVHGLISQAQDRCTANGRSTLRASDL